MDPGLIPEFVTPILEEYADYTKGNRFYNIENVRSMPSARLFGNAMLSFMAKLSTGYWDLFDPTNGYTAIHVEVARLLPFSKISKGYFFESDMLFRLNMLRAVVVDMPMDANYGDETSNLKVSKIIGEFLYKHMRNLCKRIFYNYYLRDVSLASIQLPLGLVMFGFGVIFGTVHWLRSYDEGVFTSAGTVMLATLPTLLGVQFVMSFLAHDISQVPRHCIQKKLPVKNPPVGQKLNL